MGSAAYKGAGASQGQVPVNGAALGTTANVPVVTNTSGQLVPHASGALGSAAFKGAETFATAAQGAKADKSVQSVSITSGTNNGTIKLTVNGNATDNIAVKGLGSAAYTASGAYATSAQGAKADAAMPKAGGTFTGTVTLAADPTDALQPTTKQYVDAKISSSIAASDAMVFKGTLGTNGTATALPTSSVVIGDTYKVITQVSVAADNSYTGAAVTAKVGDLVVAMSKDPKWIVVPSGDEIVTTVKYSTTTQNLTTSAKSGEITVGEAATKQVDSSIAAASTSTKLPTSKAVAAFVEGKGYKTTDQKVKNTLTSSSAGSAGLVPAPNIGEQLKFLRADGAWVIPTNTTYSVGTSSYLGITKLYTETGSATDGTMTQNAITTALNGKSPTSHTHNYAGSSSSGGAANSANKLATARTVSGGTDITLSFNYDGSGNSSANIGFYSSSASVGDKNNYPFHRFAKLDTIAASYSDKSTTFFISQDYSGGGFGIVRIVLRTNNSSLASTVEVKWLVRCGLSADSVQVGIYNVFGKTYADAFFKTGGSYAGTCFRTLASGARGGISRTWVLVNSSEVSGTSATDAKTSTECYATIAAAGTALHKQAYSSIVSGTDSGTASYANSAGSANSVAWGNVTGKPSTFAPSSHTHNYAGSSSAGGAADSAIKLNTSRNITIGNSTKSFDGTTNLSWSLNEIGIPTKSDIAACAVMYGGTTLSSSATVTDSAAQYKVISRSTGSTGDIFTKSVTLPKGLYSVMIRMKVSTISSSSNVFKLTIIDGSTTTTKYIKPNMFKAEDSYTTLGTAVENTSGTLKITLNVYSALSNQTVCVDYLAIAPTMVGVTSIA